MLASSRESADGPGPGSFISPSLCIGPSSAAYSLVLTIIIYYHYYDYYHSYSIIIYCHYCCCGCHCCSCSCYQSYVVLPALGSSLVHLLRFYDFVFKQLSAQDPRRSPSRTSCVAAKYEFSSNVSAAFCCLQENEVSSRILESSLNQC